jgi:isocitrate/isopropylmalate dehydrogenase
VVETSSVASLSKRSIVIDMKTLYVRDLGCPESDDYQVSGETFEEVAQACQKRAMEMIAAGDADYLAMAEQMKNASPEEQQKMFVEYRKKFDEAPEE